MRMAWKFSGTCAFGLFGLTTGCSDPVPPASQASASLYLTAASMPVNARCTPGAHWVNVPFTKGGGQTTNANARAGVAVDGVDQMGVKCSVKDGGGIFQVTGELKSPAVDPQDQPVNPTIITVSTQIASDQAGAMGAVSLTDSKSGSTYSSEACSFSVRPPQVGGPMGVAPGRMWASVSCPTFRDPLSSDIDAVCEISQGYVVLENCAQ